MVQVSDEHLIISRFSTSTGIEIYKIWLTLPQLTGFNFQWHSQQIRS